MDSEYTDSLRPFPVDLREMLIQHTAALLRPIHLLQTAADEAELFRLAEYVTSEDYTEKLNREKDSIVAGFRFPNMEYFLGGGA